MLLSISKSDYDLLCKLAEQDMRSLTAELVWLVRAEAAKRLVTVEE